jgi:hypothetical protein
MLRDNPIENESREKLVAYLCRLHNKVNARLKKPIFDCEKAFQYWGGECGCTDKDKPKNETLHNSSEIIDPK